MTLIEKTIAELADLVRRKRASPLEILEAFLERIQQVEPSTRAFIDVHAEAAFEHAVVLTQEVANGQIRGPLHGVPIGIKDNIDTKGAPTTSGSQILRHNIPIRNACVVDALIDQGAVVLGKLNLHEFAFGGTTVNPHTGTTRNPWDLTRIVGGSSGGSAAAVAARECPGSLGTDTGGSIRAPAALTGVTGLRPTFGVVSTEGVMPLASTLDTVGPLAATATDCALLLNAMTRSRPERLGPGSRLDGIRFGIDDSFAVGHVQPAIAAAFLCSIEVIKSEGGTVASLSGLRQRYIDASLDVRTVMVSEAVAVHARWLKERRDEYGPDLLTLFAVGEETRAWQYVEAQRRRDELRRIANDELFSAVDFILTPTVPAVAPTIGATQVFINSAPEQLLGAMGAFLSLAPAAGLPGVSLPCGFDGESLPIGLQIVGQAFDDHRLLRVASLFQKVTDWHARSTSRQWHHPPNVRLEARLGNVPLAAPLRHGVAQDQR